MECKWVDMSSYAQDQIAKNYGGWARLCDPEFKPTTQVYADFETAGLSTKQLDEIRASQSLSSRERLMLDVTEDLLRTWTRYLCGYMLDHTHIGRDVVMGRFSVGRFIDLPVANFWETHQTALRENQIALEEIESFIHSNFVQPMPGKSPYSDQRTARISELARLCRLPPSYGSGGAGGDSVGGPESDGPDGDSGNDPALVPRKPHPNRDDTAVALALPDADPDDQVRDCA